MLQFKSYIYLNLKYIHIKWGSQEQSGFYFLFKTSQCHRVTLREGSYSFSLFHSPNPEVVRSSRPKIVECAGHRQLHRLEIADRLPGGRCVRLPASVAALEKVGVHVVQGGGTAPLDDQGVLARGAAHRESQWGGGGWWFWSR